MEKLSQTLLGLFVVVYALIGGAGFAIAQNSNANSNARIEVRAQVDDEDDDLRCEEGVSGEDCETEADDGEDDDDSEETDDEADEDANTGNDKTVICHVSASGETTIKVSERAKEAHVENHGDTEGACEVDSATSSDDEDQSDDADDEEATTSSSSEAEVDAELDLSVLTNGQIQDLLDRLFERIQIIFSGSIGV